MNKDRWLQYAEIFDSWRVVPRLLLFSYSTWLVIATDRLLSWYMALPIAAQTGQASAFCGGSITALTGIGGYVYRIYSEGGRDWGTMQPSKTSTVVASTVETK
jgi:hypothetical protein